MTVKVNLKINYCFANFIKLNDLQGAKYLILQQLTFRVSAIKETVAYLELYFIEEKLDKIMSIIGGVEAWQCAGEWMKITVLNLIFRKIFLWKISYQNVFSFGLFVLIITLKWLFYFKNKQQWPSHVHIFEIEYESSYLKKGRFNLSNLIFKYIIIILSLLNDHCANSSVFGASVLWCFR